jgi:hypothetical protein
MPSVIALHSAKAIVHKPLKSCLRQDNQCHACHDLGIYVKPFLRFEYLALEVWDMPLYMHYCVECWDP